MSNQPNFLEDIKNGTIREKIETQFGEWGHTVFRKAWLVIAVNTLVLGLLISQIPQLQIDTTMESFFHEDDPARLRYNEFRLQYGRDDKVMLAIETDDVFTLKFLTQLKALHEAIEAQVPYVNDVKSLINARKTFGRNDELIVQGFLEDWPETEVDLKSLKNFALNNPTYVDNYISRDGKMAVILVENDNFKTIQSETNLLQGFDVNDDAKSEPADVIYLSDEDNTAILNGFIGVVEKFQAPDFDIYPSSGPYTTAWFLNTIKDSMATFTSLAVLAVATFLFLIFRRAVMIVLPLGVAILSMLAAMGTMATLKIPLSFSMQIVPSFLIAVGVGNSVHIFTAFFQAINKGQTKQEALSGALQHSGLAIVMTGLTTAGGLLSFLSSNMKPVVEFGIMTPLGVLFALYFSLVLLPALIAVFPINLKVRSQQHTQVIRDIIVKCGNFSYYNPYKVLFTWLAIIGTALLLATQLQFSFLIYNNLPADHFLIEATKKVDDKMAGIGTLEMIIDSGTENGVKSPDFLNRLDKIYTLIEDYPFKKVVSVVDVNKELHQALHNNAPDFYRIPQDPDLISQELLLFENSGSDDLELLVDGQFRFARVTLITPMQDAVVFNPVAEEFKDEAREVIGDQYSLETTGIMDLAQNIFVEMQYSMATTYLIALMIITPLMIFLLGSVRIGLVSMIPNLAPIIITLGVMGQFNIHLTAATLLTGSIAIGLVVDDTIHFMHNFQRYYARFGDVRLAIEHTLQTTGQAIFFTTIVLTTAFMVFIMNEVKEWAYFGFITGFCISIALLADIFLAPALVTLLNRKDEKIKIQTMHKKYIPNIA